VGLGLAAGALYGIGLIGQSLRVLGLVVRAGTRGAFRIPIGLADDTYEKRSVCLRARDRLYLYPDGVLEAMDHVGERFGEARLLEVIGRRRAEPLQESVATLMGEIARWHGSERPQDDISILAVEISLER
jgi:serine phosphatase RsbU (regulator of sigma subunit)